MLLLVVYDSCQYAGVHYDQIASRVHYVTSSSAINSTIVSKHSILCLMPIVYKSHILSP